MADASTNPTIFLGRYTGETNRPNETGLFVLAECYDRANRISFVAEIPLVAWQEINQGYAYSDIHYDFCRFIESICMFTASDRLLPSDCDGFEDIVWLEFEGDLNQCEVP